MAPILRLDTCLYRLFQKSNLLIHEDPSGKNVLSAGIEGGTAALTANQGKKLNDVLSQIINLCNENISEVANQYDAVWSERENWIEYARSQKINGVDQASENIKKFTHEVLPDAPGDAPLGDPMTSSIPQSNGEYDENNHSIKDEMDDSIGIPPSTGDQSLKYDKDNRSIEDEWFKHHDALRIKGDAKETIILFEKIFKYKGGSKSHYGVQRRIGGKYCFEMVSKFEISIAVDDWDKLERRMIITAATRNPVSKETYGGLHKYWGTAYMVPKERYVGPCRSPASECIMQISGKDGFTVMTFTNFVGLEGLERAEEYIEATSQRDKTPAPWKTHSQVIKVRDPACHRPEKPKRSTRNYTVLPTELPSGDKDLDDKICRIVEEKTASLRTDMISLNQRLDVLTGLMSKIASKLDVD